MTERDFCYWLQGLFELTETEALTTKQVKMIKDHLNLVFVHSIDTPDLTGVLQATHDGKKLLTEDDKKEIEKTIDSMKKSMQLQKIKNGPYRC